MARKYNIRLIRKRHSYTAKEIADLLGYHVGTIQDWISKGGLRPIEGSLSPYLIYGQDLHDFLTAKRQKSKRPLQPDEFYCLKCRNGRNAVPGSVSWNYTQTKVGKSKYQAIITGICVICGGKISRLATYAQTVQEQIN